jgi:pimeloyl-ACP methyl ester carboxylesterase
MYRCLIVGFGGILSAWAQLIPAGQPIPKTAKPPVVFLNGYEYDCGSASFSKAFGIADQVLQANGQVSLFFNYCSVPGSPSIEDLGVAFGAFLFGLRYTDGQPVDRVDVVPHSLGGLVVRSYLSGKLAATGTFNPPAVTHIRKIVFVATPHFGTGIGLPFGNTLTSELSSGSRFLFDLATWNQGTDDLRGVDAIAIIGNGGTGHATTDNFDDGVIALTSASLGFYMPGRTRVVPFCHVDGGGLISIAGYCSFNALGKDPDNELVHLYEIRDALTERLPDARTKLGITRSEWSRFGQLANDEPLRQGRHRGTNVGNLRDATEGELQEARRIARKMIEAYLGLL